MSRKIWFKKNCILLIIPIHFLSDIVQVTINAIIIITHEHTYVVKNNDSWLWGNCTFVHFARILITLMSIIMFDMVWYDSKCNFFILIMCNTPLCDWIVCVLWASILWFTFKLKSASTAFANTEQLCHRESSRTALTDVSTTQTVGQL